MSTLIAKMNVHCIFCINYVLNDFGIQQSHSNDLWPLCSHQVSSFILYRSKLLNTDKKTNQKWYDPRSLISGAWTFGLKLNTMFRIYFMIAAHIQVWQANMQKVISFVKWAWLFLFQGPWNHTKEGIQISAQY